MKIIVVSAHRGDAALALGLSIAAWIEQGHAVNILNCFTRSEFAPFSDAQSLHANDRMSFVTATRKREDEAWVKKLCGNLKLTDLNMKDAPLRLRCAPSEVLYVQANLEEKSASKIRKVIERSGADLLVLPLALDGHVDRMLSREAGDAFWQAKLSVAYYEDLPQALNLKDEALQMAALAVRTDLAPAFANAPEENAIPRKRRMAWCYDSQIDETDTLQIAEFADRYQGRERLWANAAALSTLKTA